MKKIPGKKQEISVNPGIFKAYDIRGIYPDQINAETVWRVARALVTFLEKRSGREAEKMRIVLGRDMRTSSPDLHAAAVSGLASRGIKIDDAGLIAIEEMYFLLGTRTYDGGLMVTASHNPKEYNGLKMYMAGVQMISAEDIQRIRTLAENDRMPMPPGPFHADINPIDCNEAYADFILSLVDTSKIKPLKVVLDAGNGMGGRIFPSILSRVPQVEAEKMYFEPDGSFPNHEANPEKLENTRNIQKRVIENRVDFGAAFDGDADRIALIDDTGRVLRGDVVTGIIATHFLERFPGTTIIYSALCTRAVPDAIEKRGGKAVMWKTGHTNMKAKMRESSSVFGGELSGHLFFKDFYFAESSALAFLITAQIISERGKKLSEIAAEFMTYATFARYIYLEQQPTEAIEKVRAVYEKIATKTEMLDGFTFYFENPWWWMNIRSSNTEARIHLTVESRDVTFTQKMRDEILALTGGRISGE